MRISSFLCFTVLLLVCAVPAQGLFSSGSLQDYVEGLVDAAQFKLQGMLSVNDSTLGRIWSYFKTKYGRAYASLGQLHIFF